MVTKPVLFTCLMRWSSANMTFYVLKSTFLSVALTEIHKVTKPNRFLSWIYFGNWIMRKRGVDIFSATGALKIIKLLWVVAELLHIFCHSATLTQTHLHFFCFGRGVIIDRTLTNWIHFTAEQYVQIKRIYSIKIPPFFFPQKIPLCFLDLFRSVFTTKVFQRWMMKVRCNICINCLTDWTFSKCNATVMSL